MLFYSGMVCMYMQLGFCELSGVIGCLDSKRRPVAFPFPCQNAMLCKSWYHECTVCQFKVICNESSHH